MTLRGIMALCLILSGPALFAQKDSTEVKVSQNLKRFMMSYFEAIKQRAMDNPELALSALNSASKLQTLNREQKSALAYEQGRNYALLNDFDRAIRAYKFAKLHPDFNRASLSSLYDIYHQQGDYPNALEVVNDLVVYDQDYYVDLIKLHMATGDLIRSQEILDSISRSWGSSLELQSIGLQIQNLKTVPPPNEQSPVADPVDYSQYTNLLQDGRFNQALILLTKILEDGRVETKTKAQAIEAFAAQSPEKQYQTAFERLIPRIKSFKRVSTEVALGRYFLNIRALDRAQQHSEMALDIDQNNKEALLLIASVNYAKELYLAGLEYAEKALTLYPADPWCYLLAARGFRYTGMIDMAEIQILSGLEFALEGSEQNRLLCLEAASVYRAKGNEKEAQLWRIKSDQ